MSYQLLIAVADRQRIRIGRLGTFDFPAGRYLYTGSARRALEARLARHLRPHKRLHWHIDYLLAAAGVAVLAVRRSTLPECHLCQRSGGAVIAPGFGASDCRAGCGSHLRFHGDCRDHPGWVLADRID
ncbi:MAG: GIY-YIG nuclease family protein [Thiobacillaceae bacterium]|nr:GIY-YIG nuclease family protein [Thiobacillaceae bacterium]